MDRVEDGTRTVGRLTGICGYEDMEVRCCPILPRTGRAMGRIVDGVGATLRLLPSTTAHHLWRRFPSPCREGSGPIRSE